VTIALPFFNFRTAVAISALAGSSLGIMHGGMWMLTGLLCGIVVLYSVLYSFVTFRISIRVGRRGRSPACLYHRCRVLHALSVILIADAV
jgi:hypothetical protein